ncbi:hypothetical protein ACFLYF_05970 [Chloroflexota bacterium]
MEDGKNIVNLERKFRTVGNQTRWWGTLVFIAGVTMAIFEVSGGVVITALGIVVASKVLSFNMLLGSKKWQRLNLNQ